MCWMTIQTGPYAIADAAEALRTHEQAKGGHSWGLAVVYEGEIHTTHGVGPVPPYPEQGFDEEVRENAQVCLGHTRWATRGTINTQNAHPFNIYDENGEVVAVLAHNGTWHDAPMTEDRADSWYIAKELEHLVQTMPSYPFSYLARLVGDYVGETLTILHRDGRAWAYSGRFDITAGDTFVASSHPVAGAIPTGRLHKLSYEPTAPTGHTSTADAD